MIVKVSSNFFIILVGQKWRQNISKAGSACAGLNDMTVQFNVFHHLAKSRNVRVVVGVVAGVAHERNFETFRRAHFAEIKHVFGIDNAGVRLI